MPAPCKICKSESRKEIERAILSGTPYRHLAARFDMSSSAVHRHVTEHMAAIVQRYDDKTAVSAKSIILDLVGDLRAMAASCKESGVGKDFLLVADRLTRATEVYGKLTGEISSTTNALFINLGVRSEEELKGKLDLARALESQGSPEESYQDFVAMGRLLLADHPQMRESLLADLGLSSYAVEMGGDEREETPGNEADSATTPRPNTNGDH